MFDVTDPYAPGLRHPDPPSTDFTEGSTNPSPTPLAFNLNPLGTQGTNTDTIKIVGAGTTGVDGDYVKNGAVYDGPGDRQLAQVQGLWSLLGFGATLYSLYPGVAFPFQWAIRNGDSPAPSGSFK